MRVHEAIGIILSDTKNHAKTLNYAINYCKAAKDMEGATLKVQCLYILNNIQYWRHPQAKEAQIVLKAFSK